MEKTPIVRRFPLHWSDEEEDLFHERNEDVEDIDSLTQPIERPLAGVIAYVDVRSGTNSTINTGQSMAESLMALGASIAPRLTKDVTHIVYKDGKTNLDRVNQRDVFVVSPLWLDSCKRCNERVSEAKYPVTSKDINGGTPVVLGKIKRVKSMQPKPFEEQVARSLERKRKRVSVNQDGDDLDLKKPPLTCPFDFLLDEDLNDDFHDSLPPVNFLRTGTTQKDNESREDEGIVTRSKRRITDPVKPVSKTQTKKQSRTSIPTTRKTLKNKPLESQSDDDELSVKQTKPKTASNIKESTSSNKTEIKASIDSTPDEKVDVKNFKLCAGGKQKKRVSFEKERPTIVMTSVPSKDQEIIHAIVEKLGGFEFWRTVNETTTHVICGAKRRTINVLAGTARGSWILSVDWVWKSLEVGHWLPEEAFEMITEFPAAQFFRLERRQAGLLYRPCLFHPAGSIYISYDTNPPPHQMELLLTLAGAKLTTSKRKADIIIGLSGTTGIDCQDKLVVSESWVIESISQHSMLSVQDFLLDDCGVSVPDSPEL